MRVEYDPPHVSVAATEVGLGDLLRLIGAKVGFSVAEGRAALRLVTVSIARTSLDDVLRQLLRAENHTILYRQGADARVMVDRIVLLGAPAEGGSVADIGPRPSHEAPAVASSASGIGASPQTAAAGAVPMSSRAGEESATTDEQQVSVGVMFWATALAGLPPQPAAVAQPAAPSMSPSLEESLAITTQRAQQGLTVIGRGPGTRNAIAPAAGAGPRDRKVTTPGSEARELGLHGLRPGTSATEASASDGPGEISRQTSGAGPRWSFRSTGSPTSYSTARRARDRSGLLQSFGLETRNVATREGHEFYAEEQRAMGVEPARVDIWGAGDGIPVPDRSEDFVLSSHVLEHLPNLIGAFLEWNRIVRDGGYVYMIVPLKGALPQDAERELRRSSTSSNATGGGGRSRLIPWTACPAGGWGTTTRSTRTR